MRVRKDFDEAVAAHRSAAGHLQRAQTLLPGKRQVRPTDRQRALVTRLAQAATVVTPGWLGQALTRASIDTPLGRSSATEPLSVRIGDCVLDEDHRFAAVINLLGTGHLAVDADPDEPRVLSVLHSVPLRLLAARPSESLNVSFVDFSRSGEVFAPFEPLVKAGMAPEVARDEAGLTQVLDNAEAHLDHARRRGGDIADLPERLVMIAGLPEDPGTAAQQIAGLTAEGPQARLHLVIADERVRPNRQTNHTTHVSVKATRTTVAGIPLEVTVDPQPHEELISHTCTRLAAARQWVIEDDQL